MSHMLNEILEQPQAWAELLDHEWRNIEAIGSELRRRDPRHVVMAARGTSDNAARYGQYVLGAWNGLPVGLATPSLYTLYDRPPRTAGALVIGISQSGASPDVVEVLAESRRQGATTLSITNDANSPLAAASEFVIPLHAGVERAVAATKTYTGELLALALLSIALEGDSRRLVEARALPWAAERALKAVRIPAKVTAGRLCGRNACLVISRGYNYATAFETALKIKELAYAWAEPYSAADFEHGPIALLEAGLPAVVIAPSGAAYDGMTALIQRLQEGGADLVIISDRADAPLAAAHVLRLPPGIPEWLSPLLCVLPGQLLAHDWAVAKGLDPDQPRSLSKVTLTL